MADRNNFQYIADPLKLAKVLWPDVVFYSKQKEVIYSVWNDDETVVPAGHMLGKDFVAGFIALAFFLTRNPCRIITTSVDNAQLEGVLWGEIRRFIQTSKYPLEAERGGPLHINHLHIRKVINKQLDGLSYLIGRVAERGEGMSGHHIARTGDGIPRTLCICDEASGIAASTFSKASEWANRFLIIGNPYQCNNYFKHAVKGDKFTKDPGGSLPRDPSNLSLGYKRRVIQIRGNDSPNVQLGLKQREAGLQPTYEIIVPGVLPYDTYETRLKRWDPIKIRVGIEAEFYEGVEELLYPPTWLDLAERIDELLKGHTRIAKAIGVDSAEGGDNTSMAAVDEYGVIEVVSKKTPDTSIITKEVLAFMHKHNVPPERTVFDRGGGGKQHADNLRAIRNETYPNGCNVRTIAFNEAIRTIDGVRSNSTRRDQKEERAIYPHRRAQMFDIYRQLLDPHSTRNLSKPEHLRGYGLPSECYAVRQQAAPIPLLRDDYGRLLIPPKSKRKVKQGSGMKSLEELIGHSPDELESVIIGCYGMGMEKRREFWIR